MWPDSSKLIRDITIFIVAILALLLALIGTQIRGGFYTFKPNNDEVALYAKGVWKQLRTMGCCPSRMVVMRKGSNEDCRGNVEEIIVDVKRLNRWKLRADARRNEAERVRSECEQLVWTLLAMFVGSGGCQLIYTLTSSILSSDIQGQPPTKIHSFVISLSKIILIFVLIPIGDMVIRNMYRVSSKISKTRSVVTWLLRPENQITLGNACVPCIFYLITCIQYPF